MSQDRNRPDNCLLSRAKEKNSDNSPDYYGRITLSPELVEYALDQLNSGGQPELRAALWKKQNESGTFLSLALSVPRQQQGNSGGGGRMMQRAQARPAPRQQQSDPFDDEIPF